MKNKTITQMSVLASVRKPLPPVGRPFKDKRATKEARKAWRKEAW